MVKTQSLAYDALRGRVYLLQDGCECTCERK